MLRDASHKQVIQKFSFIQSLNLSREMNPSHQINLHWLDQDLDSDSQSEEMATSFSQTDGDTSAIVATSATATTIDTNWYQVDPDSFGLNLAEIVKYSASDYQAVENPPPNRNYFGKILFSLAISYCLFVLWWLFGHQGSKLLTTWTGGKQIAISKSDAEFIDYAERSLERIIRQTEANQADLEEEDRVVYVPVYTPATTPTLPRISNLPLTTLSSNNPQIPKPVALAQPRSPAPLKIPAPPPLPPLTPLQSVTPSQSTAKITAAKPAIKSTLIGILELGENRSAALVKVEGQTRRIWLGEKINQDGWILESVSNQTANISYQGQVRSISVGETF